ncbi:MAG: SUMF1/EgtB/PvdO family nonheme iron enzyme [Pseudomonadota bacterium]|nr:SUMF1/EgtB/PvdO family nonheme iron enzyme [Pseudomonadota bacterium]
MSIFLASPGDVVEERAIAREAIERLPYDPLLGGKITVDLVAWDGPGGAPMEATMTPQEAIKRGLTRPSECDIVVVIFWARMGTSLPTTWESKADGSACRSGTEWEYLDARKAAQESGSPKILVYRRTEEPVFRPSDPAFMEKYQQWQAVEAFFAEFRNADGSFKGGYNGYDTPAAFGPLLADHLKALIKDRLGDETKAGSGDDDQASESAAMHAEAQNSGVAAAGDSIAIGQNVEHSTIVVAREGSTVVVGEAPMPMEAVDRESALGRYLQHVVSRNRYLQLQGIRSGGRLVHIELDRIYIRLRGTQQRLVEREEDWLSEEAKLAPGERATTETVTVSVEEALQANTRLVVLGDPGSGKTTLLRYLTLPYARDLAEKTASVQDKLGTDEPHRLPILLPLRQVGAFLKNAHEDGTEGHAQLLQFLLRSLANERIELPADFFDAWLMRGDAVLLLDGLDEVADPDLRRRVSRLVESFVRAYPDCRYLITSRIVGYTGPARLGESFATTTVREFTLEDVRSFLTNWHRLVAVGQMGAGESAEGYAAEQTRQLMEAIEGNERIRDLAINPLMLTVIAMVHRDRVKLPDRRAELYAEAVGVLLGKWDEARGVKEPAVLPDRPFDTGDKRLMLQALALHMHEQAAKEIDAGELRETLKALFGEILGDAREAARAAERFAGIVRERTGLLVDRGEGIYAFSHLTFQEYLAALAVAARDDYLGYSLKRTVDPWWREVILLEAGYLSTQSKERTTRLVSAIAQQRSPKGDPYHNLVLAAECLRDLGVSRVQGALEHDVLDRLRQEVEAPPPLLARWVKSLGVKSWIGHRARAMEALVRAGAGFWSQPYGEPDWIEIPAGTVWMGSNEGDEDEQPVHKVSLPDFRISRVPITNAQYHLFTKATGQESPEHWEESRPPKGLESHPVVNVSWHDALAYCRWLSGVTGKGIGLPSEAEWERAARGDRSRREYPWGDGFEATKCNCAQLGLWETTPVGIFPEGASRYGCLDMSGNVWEWTRSLYGGYPYPEDMDARAERENLEASGDRVLRGGAFDFNPRLVRCAYRYVCGPDFRGVVIGFRVVVSPFL